MRPSRVIAGFAFVGLVPLAIWLGYLGYERGFYPYLAVPIAVGGIILITLLLLFVGLPRLRTRLG